MSEVDLHPCFIYTFRSAASVSGQHHWLLTDQSAIGTVRLCDSLSVRLSIHFWGQESHVDKAGVRVGVRDGVESVVEHKAKVITVSPMS